MARQLPHSVLFRLENQVMLLRKEGSSLLLAQVEAGKEHSLLAPAGMNEESCVKGSSGNSSTGEWLANKSSYVLLVGKIFCTEIQHLLRVRTFKKFYSFSPLHMMDLLHHTHRV